MPRPEIAVIAGVGPGLGSGLCRRLLSAGFHVAGLARSADTLDSLKETAGGSERFLGIACDTTNERSVEDAFTDIESTLGPPRVLVYNAGHLIRGGLLDTSPEAFADSWRISAFGAFLCARRAVPGMLDGAGGTLIFTGATASIKAAAGFPAFGSAKFALRGLAQSLARELGPRGIHVAHVILDGIIWSPRTRQRWPDLQDGTCLSADAIAETYLQLIRQDRSAWTFELDLRPDVEPF